MNTASNTAQGTYPITVVFSETLPGAAWIPMALLLIPFAVLRRKLSARLVTLACILVLQGGAITMIAGCGGQGGTAQPTPTHAVTSSGTVILTVK